MKTLTVKKLIIPAVIATLAVGCAELQKPQSLLDAEKAYSSAANDPVVQKYAADKLTTANKTLMSAGTAESADDMLSLAYIGNAQVESAVSSAAAQQSRQNSIDLLTQKDELITASINAKKDVANQEKEAAQQRLLEMQANEAEREILLAFGKIEFVSGTANLVPGASQGIDLLAGYMNKYPNKTVALSGHTDSSGSAKLNKDLSQQRADFIRDVLISKGISPERIIAIGYGESQPVASNSSRSGRQKNRRIDIRFD